MRLAFDRWLCAPPAAVWPFLTDPRQMNLWSAATIRTLESGDGSAAGAVGEMREVRISWGGRGGRTTTLEEVIEESTPPSKLVYRVVRVKGGLPAREHRGVMTLDPQDGGTRFRWDVSFEFALPGMGAGVRRILEPQLATSIASLARVVVGAPIANLEPANDVDDDAALPALLADAERICDEQRSLAKRLAACDDPKRWFSRVYALVTENQITACRAGAFRHPAWVLRLVPRFHHYYMESLRRWMQDESGESHWRAAFRSMESKRTGLPAFDAAVLCVAKGARAHIEEDLPRALADVHCRYYAPRCKMARFRADYATMGNIFRNAGDRLVSELPLEGSITGRMLSRMLPVEAKDVLQARSFFDIPRARRKAFERGERIAELVMAHGHARI